MRRKTSTGNRSGSPEFPEYENSGRFVNLSSKLDGGRRRAKKLIPVETTSCRRVVDGVHVGWKTRRWVEGVRASVRVLEIHQKKKREEEAAAAERFT